MGAKGQTPSSTWIACGDRKHCFPERWHVELIAAEPPGLQHPVKPGLDELAVQVVGVVAKPLSFVLLLADLRDQRLSASDDLWPRQVRLWGGYLGNRSRRGVSHGKPPAREIRIPLATLLALAGTRNPP